MKAYLALIRNELRLASRQRVVIFFNYALPLAFFFMFAQAYHAEQGGAILQVVTMVTVLGILGNGLLGAGMRAVQERETNILRRFKVAPISPLPLLVASTVTGLLVYIPLVVVMFTLAKVRYGMQLPQHLAAALIFIMLGVAAIRAIGLILSSVVNSMAEAGVLIQIVYMTMLFLSGTTLPTAMFPAWLMTATQFIPSTYLVTGLQGIMIRNETLAANWQSVGALVLTVFIGLLLSVKLFRWEKEEKVRPAGKLWLVAVLVPFLVLGTWQTYSRDNVTKARLLDRDLSRSRSRLIRNARIIVGDGTVIENGSVLIKNGRIEEVYEGSGPDPKSVSAEPVEAAGKTLLPGLIDMRVRLSTPLPTQEGMTRALASYLFCGVTAVRSVGDPPDLTAKVKGLVDSAEKYGADIYTTGPVPQSSLSLTEALGATPAKVAELTGRSLVQQVTPRSQLAILPPAAAVPDTPTDMAGVIGSFGGAPLIFHGPAIQHELALRVQAGTTPAEAIQAATLGAAKALGQDAHFGSVTKGKDATLLVVSGNPLADIKALESVSFVMQKGQYVDRQELIKDEPKMRSRDRR